VPGAAGASAAGAVGDLQFNNGTGGLGASADLNWDDSGKVLDVGGDINSMTVARTRPHSSW
jgi:hypothetical protein